MRTVSFSGSFSVPDPAFSLLAAELAGTIRVGTLLGIIAVVGSGTVVDGPDWTSGLLVEIGAKVAEDEEGEAATMSHV
jgi:hypothetical protein